MTHNTILAYIFFAIFQRDTKRITFSFQYKKHIFGTYVNIIIELEKNRNFADRNFSCWAINYYYCYYYTLSVIIFACIGYVMLCICATGKTTKRELR